MNNIQMVNDQNYDEVVGKATKPVFLAIGAMWCVDCKRIAPFFGQFAEQYSDKLVFASCNFDENPGIKEKFDVRHIPTLVLIKDGKVVDTLVEPKSVAPFKEFVEKALAL